MKTQDAELVVTEKQAVTPMRLLEVAMSQGADLDKMEKLMALQERWEANEARKAYNAAIAKFKAENIKIIKDAAVDFTSQKGRTSYKHATLAGVIAQITEPLCKYGLSHSWRTSQDANKITVTCRIAHVAGHFEEVSIFAEPDNSGNKNSIQAVGSTITYLERYTLKAALGLAEADDDDGRHSEAPAEPCITEDQAETLRSLMVEVKGDEKTFCTYLKVERLEDLLAKHYAAAVKALEKKRSA